MTLIQSRHAVLHHPARHDLNVSFWNPHQVANMIATTTAIVAVDSHPIAHNARGSTKSPIEARVGLGAVQSAITALLAIEDRPAGFAAAESVLMQVLSVAPDHVGVVRARRDLAWIGSQTTVPNKAPAVTPIAS